MRSAAGAATAPPSYDRNSPVNDGLIAGPKPGENEFYCGRLRRDLAMIHGNANVHPKRKLPRYGVSRGRLTAVPTRRSVPPMSANRSPLRDSVADLPRSRSRHVKNGGSCDFLANVWRGSLPLRVVFSGSVPNVARCVFSKHVARLVLRECYSKAETRSSMFGRWSPEQAIVGGLRRSPRR